MYFISYGSGMKGSINSEILGRYIEDIRMFLLNMAFISSSEVQNIYIS